MRPIDADALKERVKEACKPCMQRRNTHCKTCLINAFSRTIDNAPTVPLPDFKDGYKQAILDGKAQYQKGSAK